MKKIILFMALILAAIYAALSILGSGGEYAAEKLFYRAMKGAQKITSNPDVISPPMVMSVEKILGSIPEKYPKTNVAKSARIAIVEFRIFNKKYDEALAEIKNIFEKEKGNKAMLSTAQFLKGNIYEKQDKWDRALKEYKILRDEYTDTQLGLNVPMYIGKYYADKGMEAESAAAFKDAASFYLKLERDHKDTMLAYVAASLRLNSYLAIKDYKNAGSAIENMISKYPPQVTVPQHLRFVEYIFVKELKEPGKAIAVYEGLKKRIPDENFKKVLDKRIKELQSNK